MTVFELRDYHRELKQKYPDTLLVMETNDGTYQYTFDDDAKIASDIIGGTSWPSSNCYNFFKKLSAAGHKVALCQPMGRKV